MPKSKPLSRLQSARAIVGFYDDLSASDIRKLPRAERQLFKASLEFLETQTYAKAKPKPQAKKPSATRRRTRAVSRKPVRIEKPGKRRKESRPVSRRKKPISRRKKKSLIDDYPELDKLDDLEDEIQEVLEAESERYTK